jgi:hypothetical protein
LPEAAGEATLHGIAAIDALSGRESGRWHAAGAGWRRHPALLACNEQCIAGLVRVEHPRARFLLGPGREVVENDATITPDQLVPAYVRHQVAKVPAGAGQRDRP